MISFCAIIRALASNMNKRQPFFAFFTLAVGVGRGWCHQKLFKVESQKLKIQKAKKVWFVLTAAGVRVQEPFSARITDLTSLSNDFFLLQLCSPLCFALFYEALNFPSSEPYNQPAEMSVLLQTHSSRIVKFPRNDQTSRLKLNKNEKDFAKAVNSSKWISRNKEEKLIEKTRSWKQKKNRWNSKWEVTIESNKWYKHLGLKQLTALEIPCFIEARFDVHYS